MKIKSRAPSAGVAPSALREAKHAENRYQLSVT